jgi:transcription elongation factor Elf1
MSIGRLSITNRERCPYCGGETVSEEPGKRYKGVYNCPTCKAMFRIRIFIFLYFVLKNKKPSI